MRVCDSVCWALGVARQMRGGTSFDRLTAVDSILSGNDLLPRFVRLLLTEKTYYLSHHLFLFSFLAHSRTLSFAFDMDYLIKIPSIPMTS